MDPRHVAAIHARLAASSERVGAKGHKYVDQERALTVALEEGRLMQERQAAVSDKGANKVGVSSMRG